jgi:hypothetical protein
MSAPARALGLALLLLGLVTVACTSEPSTLEASGPFPYPAGAKASGERVAILVTIANRSADDLLVNPADFVARDSAHRVYAANPTATAADAHQVRIALGSRREGLPLPMVTLRQDDVLSGYVVFDVPADAQPVELIWRQSDSDRAVRLTPADGLADHP